jgi:hypothetical protein
MALEGNQHARAMITLNALIDVFQARKLTFDRYVAAAAKAAGED